MRLGFLELLWGAVAAVVFVLLAARTSIPMPQREYAGFAVFFLVSGGYGLTLLYNKVKYGLCFPGSPSVGTEAVEGSRYRSTDFLERRSRPMRPDFGDRVRACILIIAFPLLGASGFMPTPDSDYACLAVVLLLIAAFGFTVSYNKMKFGRWFRRSRQRRAP